MASVVAFVQACLSFDCEDWVDVLAELYEMPALVTDFRLAGFVGLALLASLVVGCSEDGVGEFEGLLWCLLGVFVFRVVRQLKGLILQRVKVAPA